MRHELGVALLASLCLALGACGTTGGGTKATPERKVGAPRTSPADVNVSLAQGYLRQGNYEVALQKAQKALELDPKLASAHTVVAVIYEHIGDRARAEQHYARAASLAPHAGGELNNYGTFLCSQGKFDEADAYFVRALQDPFYKTPAVALANRGTCALGAGKVDVAEESFRKALQLDARNPDALFQLAQILFKRGDYFRARAFVQRFEDAGTVSADTLALAIRIEQGLGNEDAVREYRSRLLSEFPDSEQAQGLREAEGAQ
jgi:type IV pilus assembly protein PilF